MVICGEIFNEWVNILRFVQVPAILDVRRIRRVHVRFYDSLRPFACGVRPQQLFYILTCIIMYYSPPHILNCYFRWEPRLLNKEMYG